MTPPQRRLENLFWPKISVFQNHPWCIDYHGECLWITSVLHHGVFNNKESFEDIPDVVRVGKFTRKDVEIIQKNFDTIIEKMRKKKMKDEVLEDLFFKRHEHEMYFINILGHYLSQGLPDIRLPMDVFYRAKVLFCTKVGEPITEEESKIILDYMNNEGENISQPFAELSVKLGRTRDQIKAHYKQILMHPDKAGNLNKNFTAEDDDKIIKAALKESNLGISADVWQKLGEDLNRRPVNVYWRWSQKIEPFIKMSF